MIKNFYFKNQANQKVYRTHLNIYSVNLGSMAMLWAGF